MNIRDITTKNDIDASKVVIHHESLVKVAEVAFAMLRQAIHRNVDGLSGLKLMDDITSANYAARLLFSLTADLAVVADTLNCLYQMKDRHIFVLTGHPNPDYVYPTCVDENTCENCVFFEPHEIDERLSSETHGTCLRFGNEAFTVKDNGAMVDGDASFLVTRDFYCAGWEEDLNE